MYILYEKTFFQETYPMKKRLTFDSIKYPAVKGLSTGITGGGTDSRPTTIGQGIPAGSQTSHQGAASTSSLQEYATSPNHPPSHTNLHTQDLIMCIM